MLQDQFAAHAAPQVFEFETALIGPDALPQVLRVLDARQAALPDADRHFLKPQTIGSLRTHAAQGFPILGVVEHNTGQIAAVMLLTPAEKAEHNPNLQDYPKPLMESGAAVIGSVAVDPAFAGHRLMEKLLAGAEDAAQENGFFRFVAKVADDNTASRKGFLWAGFNQAAQGTDPKRGYAVTYFAKTLDTLVSAPLPLFNSPRHDNDQPAIFAAPQR